MNRIRIIATTLTVLLFFTGCDKYHRNKYTGDWDFVTEIVQCQYLDGWKEIERETVYYAGKISSGTYENELIIQYTENDIERVSIPDTKSTGIYSKNGLGNSKGATSGSFEGENRMYLHLCWNDNFPNGKIHYISGFKKSKK